MSKYLNEKQRKSNKKQKPQKRQKQKKKRSFGWFLLGMFIYAALFLGAAYHGLTKFWAYMEAYENSRPKIAINAYMDALTPEHVADLSRTVIDQADHNIQSEEECRQYIIDALSEGITHAKKSAECTDTRQVFVLRVGSRVIGEFAIETTAEDEYGFTPWTLAEESFDMSYLIGGTVATTVPSDYIVTANGVVLDSEYIIVDDIRYEEILEYYEDYEMPYRVTYQAGPILGEIELVTMDAEGNVAVLDENTDMSQFYQNCTAEELQKLDEFTKNFVSSYVTFTGSANKTRYDNYDNLMKYVVEGSNLSKRLYDAIEGLHYAQSKSDVVVSITNNLQMRLEEGRYVCDITYEVDTTGYEGVVRTTTNVKLFVIDQQGSLKVESMNIY